MIRIIVTVALAAAALTLGCSASGHIDRAEHADSSPPPAVIEHEGDPSVVHIEHPEQFPVATATVHEAWPALNVTGTVAPDISRAVPVVSLSTGRVIELRARLGDTVKEGQLLMRIQSADVSAAFSDYQKAQADQTLARMQLDRAQQLYDRGAVAKKDLEVAEGTAHKAVVDVNTAAARLRVLGMSPSQEPTATVDIVAPASGVITEQNVTMAAGVKTLDNSPNLFTISDLSQVWILCDVYERDLPTVRIGDAADIRLAAYPDRAMIGRVGNIGTTLDPTLRTAKVRVEVANPGLMRIGMFVTATFHGQERQRRAVVPSTAILHLHDREWVYVQAGTGFFRRVEVVGGERMPGNLQELVSGLDPGQRVAANALVLQNTVEQ